MYTLDLLFPRLFTSMKKVKSRVLLFSLYAIVMQVSGYLQSFQQDLIGNGKICTDQAKAFKSSFKLFSLVKAESGEMNYVLKVSVVYVYEEFVCQVSVGC